MRTGRRSPPPSPKAACSRAEKRAIFSPRRKAGRFFCALTLYKPQKIWYTDNQLLSDEKGEASFPGIQPAERSHYGV